MRRFSQCKKDASSKNIILGVIRAVYVCYRTIIVLEDYDAVPKSYTTKKNLSNVRREVFADGACDRTKCRWFSVLLVKVKGSLYWFSQPLLLFHLKLHVLESEEEEFAFVQYVDVTSAVDGIENETPCIRLPRTMDDSLNIPLTSILLI